jgi:hypothetical protein
VKRSLVLPGVVTDALVRASTSVSETRDGYTVVRTPEAPDFWFGNCLVLDRLASPATYEKWMKAHAEAFAGVPTQRRVVVWETADRRGLEPYEGPLERETLAILTTRRSPGRETNHACIAPFKSERDWDAALALMVQDRVDDGRPEQVEFVSWSFAVRRRDAQARRCRLWGAWIGEELVAFAGLYANAEWARFVTPITKPAYRRRGLFSALASLAIAQTLEVHPQATIVIAAARGTETESLYERLGFRAIGEQHAVIGNVANDRAAR